MTELGSKVDLTNTKAGMDAWLAGITPFPRERVIDRSGKMELVYGRTVEVSDPEDPDKMIIFFVNSSGLYIAEQNVEGITDLGNALCAEEEDYASYGKEIRRAIVDGQRSLSYGQPATVDTVI